MSKTLYLILFFSLAPQAQALNLLQEKQDISCTGPAGKTVLIDKRDRFFKSGSEKYDLTEFLDKAILAKSKKTQQSALIQMLPKNKASLIEGTLIPFREKQCKQVKAHKVCTDGKNTLMWSSTKLALNGKSYDVKHYGAYPNDGVFFMAYDENKSGIVLVDFGAKFSVIQGPQQTLSCLYLP